MQYLALISTLYHPTLLVDYPFSLSWNSMPELGWNPKCSEHFFLIYELLGSLHELIKTTRWFLSQIRHQRPIPLDSLEQGTINKLLCSVFDGEPFLVGVHEKDLH
jgi:hypothetical protein